MVPVWGRSNEIQDARLLSRKSDAWSNFGVSKSIQRSRASVRSSSFRSHSEKWSVRTGARAQSFLHAAHLSRQPVKIISSTYFSVRFLAFIRRLSNLLITVLETLRLDPLNSHSGVTKLRLRVGEFPTKRFAPRNLTYFFIFQSIPSEKDIESNSRRSSVPTLSPVYHAPGMVQGQPDGAGEMFSGWQVAATGSTPNRNIQSTSVLFLSVDLHRKVSSIR